MENAEKTEKKEAAAEAKKALDPAEQMNRFARGKLKLTTPIIDGQNKCEVLEWDFLKLTGADYVDAMDRDTNSSNAFSTTNKQAFELFAAAAGKTTPGVDATDIRHRLSALDAQIATRIAFIFFRASGLVGSLRILSE